METGMVAKQAGTSMQQHKPSDSLNKKIEIIKLLTNLSLRRQAAQNPETLALFAADLSSYNLETIAAALDLIAKRGRLEGETAFPDLGAILEAIRGVGRVRREDEALRAIKEKEKHYRENPDLYCTPAEVKDLVATLESKFSFEKPKVIDTTPVMLSCPHCSGVLPIGPNLRFMEPDELEFLAKNIRSNREIADANRAASLAKLAESREAMEVQA